MWLFNSSIGRKVVMSVTGLSLVLFLLFHASMNITLLFSQEAYNMICEFLGANWYALVGTMGLAFLAVVHIVYAFILTVQNYRARGNDRYDITDRQEGVDWNSKNMLVLGIIILCGLVLHLANFWYKMQFAEIIGHNTGAFDPTDGAAYVRYTFGQPVYVVLYVIWLCALWYHLTHGIWSALHTLGWNNNIWMKRIKVIAYVFATLIVAMFLSVVVCYAAGLEPKFDEGCAHKTECVKQGECHKDMHKGCKMHMGECPKMQAGECPKAHAGECGKMAEGKCCKEAAEGKCTMTGCGQCCKDGKCGECCKDGVCGQCCPDQGKACHNAAKPEGCKKAAEGNCCKEKENI